MKRVILISSLVLPILIFIFLRFFGKNEFTIPVYFETEVPKVPSECKSEFMIPYVIPDSTLLALGWSGNSVLVVSDSSEVLKKELLQLKQDLSSDEIQMLFVNTSDSLVSKICVCKLQLEKPWTAVLIDQQKRIRGYYMPSSREEFDRLTVELKILLNKY